MALHSNVTPTDLSRETDLVGVLDERITELLKLCEGLRVEKEKLEAERESWSIERHELIEKCNHAEQGIQNAISRLEALAKES